MKGDTALTTIACTASTSAAASTAVAAVAGLFLNLLLTEKAAEQHLAHTPAHSDLLELGLYAATPLLKAFPSSLPRPHSPSHRCLPARRCGTTRGAARTLL